ncbi:uncharacterized protein BO95DRAFT_114143 [Aspergillus brunneoviolaceus CBS 621.78]|uniref:Uncharacterized protein n=1 Tax=Aspergillus brunneoviolaceus CBS 621.78 TaxID=1450534 RepID=A0ACD1GNH3_9EURO|nr:hypothetical protein BO95DRAFT_114143 [Aspergillus brunneoviolaceus CBS 621.78]RAH50798.1 hypothetical protein BO95DRAFT_114143 [Aspergillus brunneoviolaceus CBS 621.78]
MTFMGCGTFSFSDVASCCAGSWSVHHGVPPPSLGREEQAKSVKQLPPNPTQYQLLSHLENLQPSPENNVVI